MQRIQWFRGDPTTQPGDNPDIDAAYKVTSARTAKGQTVDTLAAWIPDVTALSRVRYAYGGVESQIRRSAGTARSVGTIFIGGPFSTEGMDD